jgi:(2Fe-2S) ferredoxin
MENKLQDLTINKNINLMGSEVVDGFACKPKKLVPNKPIMHFKTHIFICNDKRCGGAHKNDEVAADLRDILKEVNLAKGENRIKISRTGCFGACRFRSVANIFENTRANGFEANNNLWLRNIHKYSKEQWIELFEALSQNKNIDELEQFRQVPISEPSTYK